MACAHYAGFKIPFFVCVTPRTGTGSEYSAYNRFTHGRHMIRNVPYRRPRALGEVSFVSFLSIMWFIGSCSFVHGLKMSNT